MAFGDVTKLFRLSHYRSLRAELPQGLLFCFQVHTIAGCRWSIKCTRSNSLSKEEKTRPICLWESNPLVSVYQTNSLPLSELQLRVFQIKKQRGWASLHHVFHAIFQARCLAFLDFHHQLDMNYVFPKHSAKQILASTRPAQLPTFACRQFLPVEVAKACTDISFTL